MDTIYIETTIVGHLGGRILDDAIVGARQRSTARGGRHSCPVTNALSRYS